MPPQGGVAASADSGRDAIAAVPRATLEERVHTLSRLFKFEFMFRADTSFESIFAETLSDMVAAGELALSTANGAVTFGAGHDGLDGRGWIQLLRLRRAHLPRGLPGRGARSGRACVKGPLSQKDLVKRALRVGERMFLGGEIERSEAVSRP